MIAIINSSSHFFAQKILSNYVKDLLVLCRIIYKKVVKSGKI